jgi:metal-responsive CopG/Arc/MetJ family transcriptional regulator
MKPIQVMIDEDLLAALDAHADTKALGRSAVLRRAAAEYLRRHRARTTAEAYRRAYGRGRGLGRELQGWPDEGAWPEE